MCNTAGMGLSVPFDVDRAFRAVDHPADHWLKGPVSGTDLGCSAELAGGARLTLFVVGERAYLNASTEHADLRVDGRCTTYDENTDSVAIASWAC